MGKLFEAVQRAGDAALRPDWDEFARYYAEDVRAWSPTYDVADLPSYIEAIKTQNAFDDVQQELTLIAETDSTVVAEWTWSIPKPAGEGRATARGLSYFVFADGKVTHLRQYFDTADFWAQLGAG